MRCRPEADVVPRDRWQDAAAVSYPSASSEPRSKRQRRSPRGRHRFPLLSLAILTTGSLMAASMAQSVEAANRIRGHGHTTTTVRPHRLGATSGTAKDRLPAVESGLVPWQLAEPT